MWNLRVVVTGGREYADRDKVYKALDAQLERVKFGAMTLIEGGALGADRLAQDWSKLHPEVILQTMEADWVKYKLAAGTKRNTDMVKAQPDICIAFPGYIGTHNMKEQCRAAKITVKEIL